MAGLRRIIHSVREDLGLYLFIFVLVAVKKWEPGGHIDATWYSAIAKNVAEHNEWFKFGINPHFYPDFFDHIPLSYWIMGGLMKLFGATDLVARSYFIVCSLISYVLVFKLGTRLKDKAFGYASVVTLALCFFFGKWAGGIKHDVPLTMAYLGFIYFFLRGMSTGGSAPRLGSYFAAAAFLAWGTFSKGPVMGGAPLGLLTWLALTKQFSPFRTKEMWGALALYIGILAIPLLPVLHFQGHDVYYRYYAEKAVYMDTAPVPDERFFYFTSIVQKQVHVFVLFLISLFLFFKSSGLNRRMLLLPLTVIFAVLIPFSFFSTKFAYYILPAYPFYSIFSAQAIDALYRKRPFNWQRGMAGLSVLAMMVLLAFPIKTTGGRPKTHLNMINVVKFDPEIKTKPVYFLGGYDDDLAVFQEYKFYGGIDLIPRSGPTQIEEVIRQNKGYLVIAQEKLPLTTAERTLTQEDCALRNEAYCMVHFEGPIKLNLPLERWPHEVYP